MLNLGISNIISQIAFRIFKLPASEAHFTFIFLQKMRFILHNAMLPKQKTLIH